VGDYDVSFVLRSQEGVNSFTVNRNVWTCW